MDVLGDILYPVIDDHNEVHDDARLAKDPACVLFGEDAVLQSMELVGFVIRVQQHLEERFDRGIELAHEKALSRRNSPFRTIGTLADYIAELLAEDSAAA